MGHVANIPSTGADTLLEHDARKAAQFLFTFLLAFIGGVSTYDGYLVVRTGESIREFEKNPIGLYLIEYNHGDPSLFLRLKAAGTIIALSALCVLHRRSQRLASRVAIALVVFQGGLLLFLENPLC